jgi:hypothetical protein
VTVTFSRRTPLCGAVGPMRCPAGCQADCSCVVGTYRTRHGKFYSSRLCYRNTLFRRLTLSPSSGKSRNTGFGPSGGLVLHLQLWFIRPVTKQGVKNAVFWEVARCRCCKNRRFEGKRRLHLQGRQIRQRGTASAVG